jgi:hypothetical protein
MCKHKLYLQPEKCGFELTKIEYLGVIISLNKVKMDLVKIAGVIDRLMPLTKKEVQLFVSFVNFYVDSSLASPTMRAHCLISP